MKPLRLYTVEGIILKRKSVGEADRILTVFTRQQGKLRVLAKGIRKIRSRRAGHVELFNRATLTLHAHQPFEIVSEASSISPEWRMTPNPENIAFTYCMCELVDQLLADGQQHEEVYDLLVDSMRLLSGSGDAQGVMSNFVHELLWQLGFLHSGRRLPYESIQGYVEHITERRLKTWPLLTALRG